mmetsp:Transcript_41498/g.74449  ORF Transcript_41498/g.74449 Transcript_41498/m.74449 type:complete len:251 (-) Transcript_41498:191-943(-)
MPDNIFSKICRPRLGDRLSMMESNGVTGKWSRSVLPKPPHSMLMIIRLSSSGLGLSFLMFFIFSTYAALLPVPRIKPMPQSGSSNALAMRVPTVSLTRAFTPTWTPFAWSSFCSIPTTSFPTTPGEEKPFVHSTRVPSASPVWSQGKEKVKPMSPWHPLFFTPSAMKANSSSPGPFITLSGIFIFISRSTSTLPLLTLTSKTRKLVPPRSRARYFPVSWPLGNLSTCEGIIFMQLAPPANPCNICSRNPC